MTRPFYFDTLRVSAGLSQFAAHNRLSAFKIIAGLIAPCGRMLGNGRSPMRKRVRELIYETAVITGGMAPVGLLALALML